MKICFMANFILVAERRHFYWTHIRVGLLFSWLVQLVGSWFRYLFDGRIFLWDSRTLPWYLIGLIFDGKSGGSPLGRKDNTTPLFWSGTLMGGAWSPGSYGIKVWLWTISCFPLAYKHLVISLCGSYIWSLVYVPETNSKLLWGNKWIISGFKNL